MHTTPAVTQTQTPPAQAPLAPRLEEWLASNTTGWHSAAQPAPITRPAPGHVYVAITVRMPDTTAAMVLIDVRDEPLPDLADMLRLPASDATAGLLNVLEKMAQAAGNRSYVLCAALAAETLEPLRKNTSLAVRVQVAEFTGGGQVAIAEIDHLDKGGAA